MTFGQLKPGDWFRINDGGKLFMKVALEQVRTNAISENAHTRYFHEQALVIPINIVLREALTPSAPQTRSNYLQKGALFRWPGHDGLFVVVTPVTCEYSITFDAVAHQLGLAEDIPVKAWELVEFISADEIVELLK